MAGFFSPFPYTNYEAPVITRICVPSLTDQAIRYRLSGPFRVAEEVTSRCLGHFGGRLLHVVYLGSFQEDRH